MNINRSLTQFTLPVVASVRPRILLKIGDLDFVLLFLGYIYEMRKQTFEKLAIVFLFECPFFYIFYNKYYRYSFMHCFIYIYTAYKDSSPLIGQKCIHETLPLTAQMLTALRGTVKKKLWPEMSSQLCYDQSPAPPPPTVLFRVRVCLFPLFESTP